MRTFRVTHANDRFTLGEREYLIPTGEAVSLEEIIRHLNAQAGPFLRFYEGRGGSLRYSHLNDETRLLRGTVELS